MTHSDPSALAQIRRLWQHSFWADRLMLAGLRQLKTVPPDALREFAHVVAVQEVWLSRIQGRPSEVPVWPTLTVAELDLTTKVIAKWSDFLADLTPSALAGTVHYANTKGQAFETPVSDILMHAALHGQYHRGKVNVHLRNAGLEPIPVDFIAWVRGVPAATQPGSADRR